MGEQAFEGERRQQVIGVNPETQVKIPGIDFGGKSHPLWQPETLQFLEEVRAGKHEDKIADFMARGCMVDIEVVKDKDDGLAIPVFGRKRVILLREANKRLRALGKPEWTIGVKNIVRGTKQNEYMLRTVSENVHRTQLNALDLAEIAFNYLQINGDTEENQEKLSVALGIKPDRLGRLLDLRGGSKVLLDAINTGLGIESALALATKPEEEQRAELEKAQAASKAAGKDKLSASDTRRIVKGKFPKPKAQIVNGMVKSMLKKNPNEQSQGLINVIRWTQGEVPLDKCPPFVQEIVKELLEKKADRKKKAAEKEKDIAKSPKKTTKKKGK